MNRSFRFACTLVLAGLLAACDTGRPPAAAADPAPVLRAYAVSPAQTQAIGLALNQVFAIGPEGHQIGRASYELPGQLLVLAPEAVQASIAESIVKIAGDAGQPKSMQTVNLRLWLLDAQPGPGDEAGQLAAIAPALEAISGNFPGYGFRIADQAEIAVTDRGHDSVVQTGAGTGITARLDGSDPMTFSISVNSGPGSETAGLALRSMVNLPPGELVVMASLQDRRDPAAAGPPPMRFLILQAVAAAP